MKVHPQVPSQVEQTPRAPEPASTAVAHPGARKAVPGADRVQISDLAGEMRAAALDDEARHAKRLEELRELIANDRYQVDPQDVADAILREEVQPWKAK